MTGLAWLAPLIGLAASGAQPDDAPASPPESEEILVTGERVARPLSETASSVFVITSDMIDSMAAPDRIEQLLAQVPNVTIGSGGEGPTIRGQDSTGVLRDLPAFLGGTRPRVTLQVDGRPVGFNEFVFGSAPIWDVEQVEIFRTPQTTTQGRNAIAGAIFVRTRDPTWNWEARARLLAGNERTRQGSVLLSGPILDDQLAFRFAGDLRRSRTSSEIAQRDPGADPDSDDYDMARLKLLAEPAGLPGLRLETSYVHMRAQAPQIEGVRRPFRQRKDSLAGYGIFRTNVDSLTAALDYRAGPSLGLTTTFSFGDAAIRRFAPPGFGRTRIRSNDLSFETLLRWNPAGPVDLVGGVHHLESHLEQEIDLTAVLGSGAFDDRQKSLGLFGEANVAILPRLSMVAGLRYQRDVQRRSGSIGIASLDFDGRFTAWLPKLSLAYDFAPDIVAGLLVQRAYNPGGTTINFDTRGPEIFGAETLWNYEAFVRAAFANGKAWVAANLFYADKHDAQRATFRTFVGPTGLVAGWAEIDNLPRAESYGLELDLRLQPRESLSIRWGVGLLHTRILETLHPLDTRLGKPFQRAPRLTMSGSVEWRPIRTLLLSAQLRHRGGYYSDDSSSPELRVGAATIIDARIAYEQGRFSLFGYARNIADSFHLTYLFGPDLATAVDPREFGIGIEARF